MNALFDELDSVVAEVAGEANIPTSVHPLVFVQHESLDHIAVDEFITSLGGTSYGFTKEVKKEEHA